MEGLQAFPTRTGSLDAVQKIPQEVKMAPKVKAKAKPKAKGKAKAKARGVPVAMRVGRRLRRPAADMGAPPAGQDPLTRWGRGEIVAVKDIALEDVLKAPLLVVEEGVYFQGECKVAGYPRGSLVSEGHLYVRLSPTGTTSEGILKLQSGNSEIALRLHLCEPTCPAMESAEDIVHVKKIRKCAVEAPDAGWLTNLAKVAPAPVDDELEALRRAAGGDPPPGRIIEGQGDSGKKDKKAKKKEKKEREDKEKDGKEKTKKKKRGSNESESSQATTGSIAKDGSRPRGSATKSLMAMYGGTALDPSERVRAKVARSAKKSVKRKEKKKKSSSSRTSEESVENLEELAEEGAFFLQASRAKGLSESHPGALTAQTLTQMRSSLMREAGMDGQRKGVDPVALQYYRTILMRKGGGPMMRELYTLSACVDSLLRGRPCHALDIMTQRMKAVESTMGGVHWTVSQRLEILGQDGQGLAPTQEVREAQRDAYSDQKTRFLAGQPEGRAGKSNEKGKGAWTKSNPGRGKGKSDKGGNKNDQARKKEEGAKGA